MARKSKKTNEEILNNNVEKFKKTSTFNFLKHIKEMDFEVGDILIKRTNDYDHDDKSVLKAETYQSTNISIRYLVVAKADGIPFIQMYHLNGKLDSEIQPAFLVEDFYQDREDDGLFSHYVVDPLQIEATIIGQGYNVVSLLTEFNKSVLDVQKYNKKNCLNSGSSLTKLNRFFETLKPGDTFYHQSGYENFLGDHYESVVVSVRKVKIKNLSVASRDAAKSLYKDLKDTDHVVEVKTKAALLQEPMRHHSFDYRYHNLYKTKPMMAEL